MSISISDPAANPGPREAIAGRARAEGFDEVGFTTPAAIESSGDRLRTFLELGRHGQMEWMATHSDRRADPAVLWPGARSLVMVARSYAPASDPRSDLADGSRGVVSVYARRRDYHDVMKGALKRLGQWTASRLGAEVKVFVDTAPLMEKPLAAAAGLGWQGKHTNLVSRAHGSWLFLGAMATDLSLEPDRPHDDRCGQCRACLDICPTQAFPAPYELDARRCISYLTIEHSGHIAPEFRAPIGNRIYGCDDCLAVCPWNKFASAAREGALAMRDDLAAAPLADLARLDDAAFRALFAGTPVKRTGRDRFVRNVMIAAGNSGDPSLAVPVAERLGDSSPLVRAMAVWAFAQIAEPDEVTDAARCHLPQEGDEAVRGEWQAALSDRAVPA